MVVRIWRECLNRTKSLIKSVLLQEIDIYQAERWRGLLPTIPSNYRAERSHFEEQDENGSCQMYNCIVFYVRAANT